MSADATTPPAAESPKTGKTKKRRTWKQRIKLTLLVLLIGGLLLRIGFNLLLPTVVKKVANTYDLDCTYDRMTMSVFGGNAHIWNLVLRPKSGGESIVKVDYLQGNLSTANLLRGRLVVWRAEVDGVNMLIDREPDGTIPLLARFAAPPTAEPKPAEKPADPGQPKQADLQAPLRIDSVRVSHVIARFRDRSVSPAFDTTVRTTLRLTDVGKTDLPANFELEVDANPVLDTLAIYGEMRNTPTAVDAELSFLLRGLHPKPAAPYLLPLGLKPIANDITVRAKGTLKANVIPNTPDIAAQLTMSDITASADTAEWASLKSLTVDVKKLSATNVEVGKVQIQSAKASARRSEEGGLQIAGFELVPVAAAVSAPPAAAKPAPAASTPSAFRASLDELAMTDLEAAFDDTAVRPATRLAARLESMSVKNIIFDPAQRDAVVDIDGAASLPNAVRSITWKGTATPFADKRQVKLKLRADGIKPEVARPYLSPLGISSDFADGAFTADLSASTLTTADGTPSASATVSNIKLTDRGVTLLEMPSAALNGLAMTPDGVLQVAAIDVTGPAVVGRRDADGSLMTLGLRYQPTTQPVAVAPVPAKTKPAPPPTTKPAAPATAIVLPKLKIDRLAWKDIQFKFEDGLQNGTVVQSTVNIEASDLSTVAATTPTPGSFKASLQAPGIADRLSATGSLSATAQGVSLDSDFSGQGITGKTIETYLKPLGVVVTLKDGQLQGKASVALKPLNDGLQASAQLTSLSYADGEQELAGADAVRIGPVDLSSKGIAIETFTVTKPRGRVIRHADGLLEAAGLKLVPLPPPPPQPAPATPTPPQPLKLTPAPITLTLKQLLIEDGALMLTDRVPSKPLETAIRGGVQLDGVSLATGAAPAKLNVKGSVDGIVGSAVVTGTLTASPDSPAANLTITAEKIDGRSVAPYMPPGMESTLIDGRFVMTLDAAANNSPAGGIAAHLSVRDLVLEDRAAKVSWAKVGSFQVRVARFDPAGLAIDVNEVSSAGVELDVQQRPDGTTEAAGMRIGVAPPPQKELAQPAVAATTAPATRPMIAATTQPAVDIAALVADARRPLPLVNVKKLDLKLEKLRVRGLTGQDGEPLELNKVRLFNTGPIQLAGENAETRPPLKLQIDGAIDPVVGQFYVGIDATPLAAEPAATIDVKAEGINGQGLVDLLPTLATTIEGKNLTDGVFITQLKASLNYGRRGPRDLDLARGSTAEFTVAPLHFKAKPDGEILAGVKEIRGEGIKVDPKNGNVTLKSIEVVEPIGRVVRDKEGIHALGLVIPVPETSPTTTQPAEAKPIEPPVASAAPKPATRPAGEIRLDRFAVSGIDLIVEDRTATPVTIIPLKTFDLEVRDLSNQMPWTGKPMRFDLLCTADKVPLPPRKGAEKGFGATTQTAEGEGEMRELFSQVTANGRIGLVQLPDGKIIPVGWAKTSVNGFDLLGVRGLTQPKVTIGGGVFDDRNEIRFLEDGSIETQNRVVFTNLSLTEAADGPLRAALNLPAPIDFVINRITDADGSITMDVPVTVEHGAVDSAAVVGPALGAVSKVILTAFAAAPVKAVESIGSALGLGPGEKKPEPPVPLQFVTGSAVLTPESVRQLAALGLRLTKEDELELQLRHVLTSQDVESLGRRANPHPGDVRLLTEQLRREKTELLARRAALADEARIQFASQAENAAITVAALRTTDRQLAQLDTSLDQLFELLRPGAANQADRRTRAACLALAKDRFDVIQQTLADAGVPGVATRVRRTNPQFEVTEEPTAAVVITLVPKKE